MLFDLRKFLSAGISPTEKRFTIETSDWDNLGAVVEMPIEAVFTAQRMESEVELHLEAAFTVSGPCARCLDPVKEDHKVDAHWVVREVDFMDEDFELPMDGNGVLDVDAWLHQEITLEIPPVLLCSPDCLGLCPVCGKKRQECSCPEAAESTSADARLSILQSLLN